MTLKDISFADAHENIFYDQALLESSEGGNSGEVLRFWEASTFFVVLGRASKFEDDIKVEQVRKDDIVVVRRASGGGTVLQGPGCLNYSLVLSIEKEPSLRNIRRSYEYILGRVCHALSGIGIEATFAPVSDIVCQGRKFSGNAQSRRRRYLLHHGTILYNFPVAYMEKYLAIPKKQPAYRKNRNHSEFVTNIDATPSDIKHALASEFIRGSTPIMLTSRIGINQP